MFCHYCGKPNPDDASFCGACGKRIAWTPQNGAAAPDAGTAPPSAASAAAAPWPAAAATSLPLEGRVLSGHRFPVYSLTFSPDGRRLASGSLDNTARLWDVEQGREIRSFPGTSAFVSLDFSADGQTLAMAASEMTDPVSAISLWNTGRPEELRALTGHQGRCMCVRFHPDGHLLASTEGGMTVNIWDVATRRIIRTLKQGMLRSKTHGGAFRHSLAFSPNGRHLATRSWPVTIWDVYDGRQVMTLSAESSPVMTPVFIAFAPDGQHLVEVRTDSTVRLWHVYRDQIVSVLGRAPAGGGTHAVQAVAMSQDARYVAVATYSSSDEHKYVVTVWDLVRERQLGRLASRDGSQALAFSPDGQWLAITDTTYSNGQASGFILFQSIEKF